MISDEQLIALEAELVEQNRFNWYGEIKLLIDEIWRLKTAYENEVIKSVKLEREAEWLAQRLVNHGICPPQNKCADEEVSKCTKKKALKCWIKEARKAVGNDNE